MPCDSRIIGNKLGPFEYDVDQFWAMAYAGAGERVARVACRFGAMVFMPSELTLRVNTRERHDDGDRVSFELLNADGGPLSATAL
jgi:hypothetical protein